MRRARSVETKKEDPFDRLPSELWVQVINWVVLEAVSLYRTLYWQMAMLSWPWHRVVHSIGEIQQVTDRMKRVVDGEIGRQVPGDTVLSRLSCSCGASCNSFRFFFELTATRSLIPTLCRLVVFISGITNANEPVPQLKGMTPADFFTVAKIVTRNEFLRQRVNKMRLSRHPPKTARLDTLYLMLPYKGDQVYVPLWSLRHWLCKYGAVSHQQVDVQPNTPYSSLMLAGDKGEKLMPRLYNRGCINDVGDEETHDRVCCTARTFCALSKEESAEFLALHEAQIKKDLYKPGRLYRLLAPMAPEQFVHTVNQHRRMLQQDCHFVHTLLSRLRDAFLATASTESQLLALQLKGHECHFCHQTCFSCK